MKSQFQFEGIIQIGGKNMEKKDKVGLKTTVALMLLLLFFFVQGAIVVITKIKGAQSAIVRGTVI